MASLLSRSRPDCPIFAFTSSQVSKRTAICLVLTPPVNPESISGGRMAKAAPCAAYSVSRHFQVSQNHARLVWP